MRHLDDQVASGALLGGVNTDRANFMNRIDPNRMREVFRYDPNTGKLWRIGKSFSYLVNSMDGQGYIRVDVDGKKLMAHRIAYSIVSGEDPCLPIDHINGNRSDNRFDNLRVCSHLENSRNRKKNSNNSSGFRGVYYHSGAKKWRACIIDNGSFVHIGYFVSASDASKAYEERAKKVFGKFYRPL